MKKVYGFLLILLTLLLCAAALRFYFYVVNSGIHFSVRALLVCLVLVIIAVSYLLSQGFRLLK